MDARMPAIGETNRVSGRVHDIRFGIAESRVDVVLARGKVLYVDIPTTELRCLGVKVGSDVIATLRFPWLTNDVTNFAASGRNVLAADIISLSGVARVALVVLRLESGDVLSLEIDRSRMSIEGLETGRTVNLIIKAAHIRLASRIF